jgi:3-carboxy-cis,cis-muconate cycloisomerase
MAANLAATKGLPLAEHVASLLAGVLGGAQAHDLVAEAGARAVGAGLPLSDVLLAVPKLEERLTAAGITSEQIDSALEPSGYLGSADAFVTAALDAHRTRGVPNG